MGAGIGFSYSYYWWTKYIGVVDESYDAVKDKMAKNPEYFEQAQNDDSNAQIVKNFGLSTWNSNDTEDDFDHEMMQQSAMEGTAQEESDDRKKEIKGFFY